MLWTMAMRGLYTQDTRLFTRGPKLSGPNGCTPVAASLAAETLVCKLFPCTGNITRVY